ncbi:hypothetical protein Salat_0827800 [Sesamum alatum]|uniref:ARGOS-like protein n=1 Tax=Sesamum alatum TaxID=300844 RepID=A0AAE2CVY7_9LAMI|nr:hypothetical protein Salat_0827800 [Sesamum alatum]
MSVEQQSRSKMELMNLENRYLNSIMDVTSTSNRLSPPRINNNSSLQYRLQVKKVDYHRRCSFSQGHAQAAKKMFRYFTLESLFLLLCLTMSLLILPLVLPPLPPPPFMLLLLPILIMALLMLFAFIPSHNATTHTCV